MAMSRVDFVAIAEAVAEAKSWTEDDPEGRAYGALREVTRTLARACAGQYTGGYGFNRPRFLEACGFPDADQPAPRRT